MSGEERDLNSRLMSILKARKVRIIMLGIPRSMVLNCLRVSQRGEEMLLLKIDK